MYLLIQMHYTTCVEDKMNPKRQLRVDARLVRRPDKIRTLISVVSFLTKWLASKLVLLIDLT
jgi:hypothetical protein